MLYLKRTKQRVRNIWTLHVPLKVLLHMWVLSCTSHAHTFHSRWENKLLVSHFWRTHKYSQNCTFKQDYLSGCALKKHDILFCKKKSWIRALATWEILSFLRVKSFLHCLELIQHQSITISFICVFVWKSLDSALLILLMFYPPALCFLFLCASLSSVSPELLGVLSSIAVFMAVTAFFFLYLSSKLSVKSPSSDLPYFKGFNKGLQGKYFERLYYLFSIYSK